MSGHPYDHPSLMAEPEVGVSDDTAQELSRGLWIGLARAKSDRTGTTSLAARRLAWHQEEVNTETAERRPAASQLAGPTIGVD